MLPFLIKEGELPFANGDYLFFPQIRKAVEEKDDVIRGYVVGAEGLKEFEDVYKRQTERTSGDSCGYFLRH